MSRCPVCDAPTPADARCLTCGAAPVDSASAFRCPVCGAISHHPMDVAEGYCGRCHDWTRPPKDKP